MSDTEAANTGLRAFQLSFFVVLGKYREFSYSIDDNVDSNGCPFRSLLTNKVARYTKFD